MGDDKRVEFRVRNIPDNDYWKFKAICALEKVGVNEKLLQLIHDTVVRNERLSDENKTKK